MKIYALATDVQLQPERVKYEERIISVFLERNENLVKTNFRCINCGKMIFKYSGDVITVFDGAAIPVEKAEIDVMCGRCKIIYRAL